MRHTIFILTALAGLLGTRDEAAAEVSQWRLGGEGGQVWADWTAINIMMDLEAIPGAIQPFELKPNENIVFRLGPWERWKEPKAAWFRPGHPRIWRANVPGTQAQDTDPRVLVDGDSTTAYVAKYFTYVSTEFYTLDLGAKVPAERVVFYPPAGVDPFFGEPYRPGYAPRHFEITASNDVAAVEQQTGLYRPLDILLGRVENNFAFVAEVLFPLQYLRIFRIRQFPDSPTESGELQIERYGIAEIEVFGRGFVPEARWESQVVDLEQVVNVGQVTFGLSQWRREGNQLVEAPEAPVKARIELKTGRDETPIIYYTYNDMGQLVEATQDEYEKLKPRVMSWDPPAVGWRGPITTDEDTWSFWSAPLERSGDRPQVLRGRYFQVRVQLETKSLWEFVRLDSLVVETGPLLAERVKGEVAVAGDLQPAGNLGQVRAGELTEFVYEMGAEFSATDPQPGFDAVRVLTPSKGVFLRLEMGDPLSAVKPDSVAPEKDGFTVYLPRRISPAGDQRLRIWLEATIYDAAGELQAEVFERIGATLPQGVEPGDVSAEVGTNQLRVLALASSWEKVLGAVEAQPPVLTPQGDGVNEQVQIAYTLFSVLDAHVEIEVYSLGGQRVRQLWSGPQGAGRHTQAWNGRDDQGQVVGPGLYLARVEVDSGEGRFAQMRAIAVAY